MNVMPLVIVLVCNAIMIIYLWLVKDSMYGFIILGCLLLAAVALAWYFQNKKMKRKIKASRDKLKEYSFSENQQE